MLGIGLNAAVFSVAYGVLLRPLPFPDPERIVHLSLAPSSNAGPVAAPALMLTSGEFSEWETRARIFESAAIFSSIQTPIAGAREPAFAVAAGVSSRFFDVFEMPTRIGRTWRPDEERSAVAVLSERLWVGGFNGDPTVVGRRVVVGGVECDVIGVMPRAFAQPSSRVDAWIPLEVLSTVSGVQARDRGVFQFVGRLRKGVTVQEAEGDARRVAAEIPDGTRQDVRVTRIADDLVRDVRLPLQIAMVTAGAILLIVCVNLANLLLARSTDRTKEFAVRTALGASRWRIVRQVLIEGVTFGLLGTAGALAIAWSIVTVLQRTRPASLPRTEAIALGTPVLSFSLLVGIVASVVFASLPAALAVCRVRTAPLLADGDSVGSDQQHTRWRELFVVAQLALAVTLTVGAGVLTRTFVTLLAIDPGIDIGDVLIIRIMLPPNVYRTPEQQRVFFSRLLDNMRQLPVAQVVGVGTALPPNKSYIQINPPAPGQMGTARRVLLDLVPVSDGFLPAVGARLKRGRLFTSGDTELSPPVAIVSERAAALLAPQRDPLGISIPVGRLPMPSSPRTAAVVGVIDDVRYSGLEATPDGAVYVPFRQRPIATAFVALKTSVPSLSIATAAVAQVRALDPEQLVAEIRTLRDNRDEAVGQPRVRALLADLAATLAIVIAAAGMFSVTAYAVSRRVREIGIRMSLGATSRDVLRLFLGRASRAAALGIGIGLLASLVTNRWLATLLFGIGPDDITAFIAAAILNGIILFVAVWVPARRATMLDPSVTLRAL
jgi:putative ABC transport system permease protein